MLFARYDIQPRKKLNPPAYSDSKGIIRASFGNFEDEVTPSDLSREGALWMLDALWNVNESFFVSGRISEVSLNGGKTASFNGITAKKFRNSIRDTNFRT